MANNKSLMIFIVSHHDHHHRTTWADWLTDWLNNGLTDCTTVAAGSSTAIQWLWIARGTGGGSSCPAGAAAEVVCTGERKIEWRAKSWSDMKCVWPIHVNQQRQSVSPTWVGPFTSFHSVLSLDSGVVVMLMLVSTYRLRRPSLITVTLHFTSLLAIIGSSSSSSSNYCLSSYCVHLLLVLPASLAIGTLSTIFNSPMQSVSQSCCTAASTTAKVRESVEKKLKDRNSDSSSDSEQTEQCHQQQCTKRTVWQATTTTTTWQELKPIEHFTSVQCI